VSALSLIERYVAAVEFGALRHCRNADQRYGWMRASMVALAARLAESDDPMATLLYIVEAEEKRAA